MGKKTLYLQDLQDNVVYSYSDFKLVLKSHGLPHSDPSVIKMERRGLMVSPRLPTAKSEKSPKVYTGRQVKEIVEKLLKEIEHKNFA